MRAARDWRKPALALFGLVLMEFGDFAMMRPMLLGIKDRAESLFYAEPTDRPAGRPAVPQGSRST